MNGPLLKKMESNNNNNTSNVPSNTIKPVTSNVHNTFEKTIDELLKLKEISKSQKLYYTMKFKNHDDVICSIWETFCLNENKKDFLESLVLYSNYDEKKIISAVEKRERRLDSNSKKKLENVKSSVEEALEEKKRLKIIAMEAIVADNLIDKRLLNTIKRLIHEECTEEGLILESAFEIFCETSDYIELIETAEFLAEMNYNPNDDNYKFEEKNFDAEVEKSPEEIFNNVFHDATIIKLYNQKEYNLLKSKVIQKEPEMLSALEKYDKLKNIADIKIKFTFFINNNQGKNKDRKEKEEKEKRDRDERDKMHESTTRRDREKERNSIKKESLNYIDINKFMLFISHLNNRSLLNPEKIANLKNLFLQKNHYLIASIESYDKNKDVDEFEENLQVSLNTMSKPSSSNVGQVPKSVISNEKLGQINEKSSSQILNKLRNKYEANPEKQNKETNNNQNEVKKKIEKGESTDRSVSNSPIKLEEKKSEEESDEAKFNRLLEGFQEEYPLDQEVIDFLQNRYLVRKDENILSAFESYEKNKDDDDFKETIDLFYNKFLVDQKQVSQNKPNKEKSKIQQESKEVNPPSKQEIEEKMYQNRESNPILNKTLGGINKKEFSKSNGEAKGVVDDNDEVISCKINQKETSSAKMLNKNPESSPILNKSMKGEDPKLMKLEQPGKYLRGNNEENYPSTLKESQSSILNRLIKIHSENTGKPLDLTMKTNESNKTETLPSRNFNRNSQPDDEATSSSIISGKSSTINTQGTTSSPILNRLIRGTQPPVENIENMVKKESILSTNSHANANPKISQCPILNRLMKNQEAKIIPIKEEIKNKNDEDQENDIVQVRQKQSKSINADSTNAKDENSSAGLGFSSKKTLNSPILNRLMKKITITEITIDPENKKEKVQKPDEDFSNFKSSSNMNVVSNKVKNSPIKNAQLSVKDIEKVQVPSTETTKQDENTPKPPDEKQIKQEENKKIANSPILNRLMRRNEMSKVLLEADSKSEKAQPEKPKDNEKLQEKKEETSNTSDSKKVLNSPILNRLLKNKETVNEFNMVPLEKESKDINKEKDVKVTVQEKVPVKEEPTMMARHSFSKNPQNSPIMNRLIRNKEAMNVEVIEEVPPTMTEREFMSILENYNNKLTPKCMDITKCIDIITELFIAKNKNLLKNLVSFKKTQNSEELSAYFEKIIKSNSVSEKAEDKIKRLINRYISSYRLLPNELQYLKSQYLVKNNKFLRAAVDLFFQTDNMDALKEDIEKVLQGLRGDKIKTNNPSGINIVNDNKTNDQQRNQKNIMEQAELTKKISDNDKYNNFLNSYVNNFKIKEVDSKILRNALENRNNLLFTSIEAYLKFNDESALKKSIDTVLNKQKQLLLTKTLKVLMKNCKPKEYELELIRKNFDDTKNPIVMYMIEKYFLNLNEDELINNYLQSIVLISEYYLNEQTRRNASYMEILTKLFAKDKKLTQENFQTITLKLEEGNKYLLDSLDAYEKNPEDEEIFDAINIILLNK